jgi:C4-dicarboxylate-specific signal transduction histidine kinase
MGHLAASVAHEINQPIGAARNNAYAALRFLAREPPDLAEVREALGCVISETYRAGDILGGIREQIKKAPPRQESFDLSEAIRRSDKLVRGELFKQHVSVQMRLTQGLPLVRGDRVQLQQVVLNLIVNAIEVMTSTDSDARELVVSTESNPAEGLLVAVGDSGPGVAAEDRERIFESFVTTKRAGVGLAFRFAVPSSRPMAGDCGPTSMSRVAPSCSRYRCGSKPTFSEPNETEVLSLLV